MVKEEQAISRCRLLGPERDFPLFEGENLIGRGSECGIRIPSSTVSRVHARLTVDGAQGTIEDLESKNGTFVAGARLEGPARLSAGDEIRVGSVRLVWQGVAARVRDRQLSRRRRLEVRPRMVRLLA